MLKETTSLVDRFCRYVKIDTQSNPTSSTFPSTSKQFNLLNLLVEELHAIGINNAKIDEFGYVIATIYSNTDNKCPIICFCSHVDTAPDCSGSDVKPIVHINYQGKDIILPDDNSQIITTSQHPYLKEKIGDDLITASGNTLLGADDKAGVAIIMELAKFLIENPDIKHGEIKILFTPDEEVGRGVDKLDIKKVGADFGYTLDGGELGSIESETFSADAAKVIFKGISAHPGYAKGMMVNAIKVASKFIDLLPRENWSPETTHERQGFVHPLNIEGNIEQSNVDFIVRDFDTNNLSNHHQKLKEIAEKAVSEFPGSSFEYIFKEQYRNMFEKIKDFPFLTEYPKIAMQNVGVTPTEKVIRGGTDGSRLSFMGMPCPNLFTGEMAIHSKHEFVSVQDMQKAVNTLIELVKIFEKHQN